MKKAKNILLKVKIKGNGVVNYDSGAQKEVFKGSKIGHKFDAYSRFNNISYAKKNFYKSEDGELSYKLKISSDCLKNEIFKDDILVQSPNIMGDETVLTSFIASPTSMLRGYMFINKTFGFKRKSVISLTDAEQTNNAVSYLETFSRSGKKEEGEEISENSNEKKENDTEKVADNSFYKKETVGEIEYSLIGNIDVRELQFVSCDGIFDRMGFRSDRFDLFKLLMGTKLPNFNSELGYYQLENAIVRVPEYGFKFSDDNVLFLVKDFLLKLLNTNIRKKSGYADVVEIQYKIVENAIQDTFADQNNWVTVVTENDIDSINFTVDSAYTNVESVAALKSRDKMEEEYQKLLKTKKVKTTAPKKSKKKEEENA